MKIGIGVITMGVREISPKLYNNSSHEVFVYTDYDKLGPGHARNKCLSHFDGYDHVFLFDDDCYPVRKGWEDYFIEHAQSQGIHYMVLPEIFGGQLVGFGSGEMTLWNSALGCFVYQDAFAMQVIGGYNTAYNRYGFEDAARNRRAIKANLTGDISGWCFPLRGLGYIHSEDVFWENPTPNIVSEDKQKYIEQNHSIFLQELNSEQLFYPYK